MFQPHAQTRLSGSLSACAATVQAIGRDADAAWAALCLRAAGEAAAVQGVPGGGLPGERAAEGAYLHRAPQLTRRVGEIVRDAVVASAGAESPLLGGERPRSARGPVHFSDPPLNNIFLQPVASSQGCSLAIQPFQGRENSDTGGVTGCASC